VKIEQLVPDAAPAPRAQSPGGTSFAALVDAAGAQLERADRAEASFRDGAGGITEMMIERVRADIALQIATTAASRATQALNSVLGMQI